MDGQNIKGGQPKICQQPKGIAGIAAEEVDTYLVVLWGCETCFGWCETLHSAERPSKAEKEEPLSTCTGHRMSHAPHPAKIIQMINQKETLPILRLRLFSEVR